MNDSADNVTTFLQVVGARLPGPKRHRAAILAELEDGLREAAESNQRAGLERSQAVTAALDEFGDAEMISASFGPELMIARGRQTALTLLVVSTLVIALWIAAARSRPTTAASRLFDSPVDHAAAALLISAVIASGIWTIATTGRTSRLLRVPPRATLIAATAMGLITAISDLAAVAILGPRLASFPGTIHAIVLVSAIAASCMSALLGTRGIQSCLAMIKRPL